MNVIDGKYAGELDIAQVVEQFNYRIQIHESYMGLVQEDPEEYIQFGSVEFHEWAVNGYRYAIYWLTVGVPKEHWIITLLRKYLK